MLKPGDAYILRSGGGGGFGSPLERDLDALERDVRGGYVSRELAEKTYGAVFSADGTIDRAATALRRRRDAQTGPAGRSADRSKSTRPAAAAARP